MSVWIADQTRKGQFCFDQCHQFNCVAPTFMCWSRDPSAPEVTVFGDRGFREVMKVK